MRGTMGGLAALMAIAAPTLASSEAPARAGAQALSEPPSAFVTQVIADAKAQGVFVDASSDAEPRARHVASGVVCRFEQGQLAAIHILPGRENVGCTMRRDSGILALQVQRVPAGVDAGKFLADMVEVVRTDFPGAKPMAERSSDPASPAIKTARFSAVFESRPVYVQVSAFHAGVWMVSAHIVAPRKDAAAADKTAQAEVRAAVQEVVAAP